MTENQTAREVAEKLAHAYVLACNADFIVCDVVDGGKEMTKEQLKEKGLNDSITHVDFMIGTADLSIVGTTRDGREVKVFENGNFAI